MSDFVDLFQAIRSEIVSLEETAKKAAEATVVAITREDDAKERARLAVQNTERIRKEELAKAQSYTDKKERLGKEAFKLQEDVNVLVQRKSDLMIANSKLENANLNFRKYEDKAWKALDAKDEELKSREAALTQKENFSPRTKSFLPPMM